MLRKLLPSYSASHYLKDAMKYLKLTIATGFKAKLARFLIVNSITIVFIIRFFVQITNLVDINDFSNRSIQSIFVANTFLLIPISLIYKVVNKPNTIKNKVIYTQINSGVIVYMNLLYDFIYFVGIGIFNIFLYILMPISGGVDFSKIDMSEMFVFLITISFLMIYLSSILNIVYVFTSERKKVIFSSLLVTGIVGGMIGMYSVAYFFDKFENDQEVFDLPDLVEFSTFINNFPGLVPILPVLNWWMPIFIYIGGDKWTIIIFAIKNIIITILLAQIYKGRMKLKLSL